MTPDPTPERIEVTPMQSQIAAGATVPFQATGFYADGTKKDLTGEVVWVSSNEAVAAISNSQGSVGLALGRAAGTSTVSANLDGIAGSGELTVAEVNLNSVEVLADRYSMALGSSQALSAYGLYADGSRHEITKLISWSSSAAAIVSIDSSGRVSALTAGAATITAKYGDYFSGQIKLTVEPASLNRIEVVPASASQASEFPVGTFQALKAVGVFDDHTTQDLTGLDWQSSDTGVVTIEVRDSQVLVRAVGAGTATVTATDKTINLHGEKQVTVRAAELTGLQVYAPADKLTKGETLSLAAIGVFDNGDHPDLTESENITWKSSNDAVLTVSNAVGSAGVVSAVGIGQATISAEAVGATGSIVSASVAVTVNDAVLEGISIDAQGGTDAMVVGSTLSLTATGSFSDGSSRDITDDVIWRSSPEGVVAVDNGLVTAIAQGGVTISAYFKPAPQQPGTLMLQVIDALARIDVTPADASIALGTSAHMRASGVFADGRQQDLSDQVEWTSSDNGIANVSAGLAASVGTGTATISAALGTVSGNTTLTVTSAALQGIEIASARTDVAVGTGVSLSVEALFSDGTRQPISAADVYWASSDESVVTVVNAAQAAGLAAAKAEGSSTVTANYDGKSAQIVINAINDPQAPASLSVFATVNVLLNDGTDTTTIRVAVGAAGEGATVADGTPVTFSVDASAGTLAAASATTANGIAEVTVTAVAGYKGVLQIDVAVPNTDLTGQTKVYATNDFSEVIWRIPYFEGLVTDGVVQKDSIVAIFTYNLSNRSFDVQRFSVTNAGLDLYTEPGSGTNQLGGGRALVAYYQLPVDVPDQGFTAAIELADPSSGTPFNVSVAYDLPLNVPAP